MSLLQENRKIESSSKKLYMICGIGIISLLIIVALLLVLVGIMNKNQVTLSINGKKAVVNNYLINKDDTTYIELENLVKAISSDGYTYRRGNKDVEDDNQCYVINSTLKESTFFKVGTSSIYKIVENTGEYTYYELEKPVIKENNKIYISINDCKTALNMRYVKNNNKHYVSTLENIEKTYNKQASSSFVPDTSIVWETLAENKKLLNNRLVIVKDSSGNLGLATVSSETDKKKKVTKVTTKQIITPKYKYIKYVEKYNQLIVETQSGRGIIELIKKDDGSYDAKTLILPQYDDIKPIDGSRFIICVYDSNSSKTPKYGIIDNTGEELLPAEYQKIGIDAVQFSNNGLVNPYIIFDYLIPVKKDDLWGFVNLNGQKVIDLKYTDLGCKESNTSSNVFVVPSKQYIVVKKDSKYGIITKTGKTVVSPTITKVYKEEEDGNVNYYMIYNDKKVDILKYNSNSKS